MFGLGRKPDHTGTLMEFFIDEWHMKPRYAGAFMSIYGGGASASLEQGMERTKAILTSMDPADRLRAIASGDDDPRQFAIAAEAYKAYLTDLRRGKHVGTDVEVAVWAILWNVSHIVETIDRGLATYIVNAQPEKFPDLDLLAFEE